jgi:hypothetical protein
LLLLLWALCGTRGLSRDDGRFFCKYFDEHRHEVLKCGFIPKSRPSCKIGMVDLTLRIDMLARANNHGLCGRDVDQGRLARIGVRYPNGYGVSVSAAPEIDRYRARDV